MTELVHFIRHCRWYTGSDCGPGLGSDCGPGPGPGSGPTGQSDNSVPKYSSQNPSAVHANMLTVSVLTYRLVC